MPSLGRLFYTESERGLGKGIQGLCLYLRHFLVYLM